MNKWLVNIILPLHVPECPYEQRMWWKFWSCCSCSMVTYGCRRFHHVDAGWNRGSTWAMPTQVNNKARSYTRLVCRDHGSLGVWSIGTVQSMYAFVHASMCQSEWSSKCLEWKRHNSSFLIVPELLEWSYAKLGVMIIMRRVCKYVREQGWVDLGGRMVSISV